MSNIERHGGSTLAINDQQTFWNDNQRAALHQLGVDQASDADLGVFFHQCQRTGLDPFARQIYMIGRKDRGQIKYTIQTGIDGFRLIARRATDASRGTLGYEDTLWCDESGQWTDVWLRREPPAAAKVTVIRNGERFPAVALFTEYAGYKYDGGLTKMWADKGALMLAKCAEALALRKAFPQDLSGLYTSDEMQQADNGQQSAPAPVSRTRQQVARSNRDAAMQALQSEPAATPALGQGEADRLLEMATAETDVDGLRKMHNHVKSTYADDERREDLLAVIAARGTQLKNESDQPVEAAPVDAEIVDEDAA